MPSERRSGQRVLDTGEPIANPSDPASAPLRTPRVGIVVLNWRRYEDTAACLRSLARLDYPDVEVVVVDNGSGDGSAERIRVSFPWVTLIAEEQNLGFAAGSNLGIRHALRQDARYILLLNNDTEVEPSLLWTLVQAAAADPRIGVAGPKILYFAPSDLVWSAGGVVDWRGMPSHPGSDERDVGALEAPRDVDYITGCALLVRREVVEAVGDLDERFFAYFEETEWCARARRAGYRITYVPTTRVWHKVKPGERALSAMYVYLMTRNRLLYLRCVGASPLATIGALAQILRTQVSWAIRPRHAQMRPFVPVVARALLDSASGRFGPPPRSI
jgi:GT2 family glycosyltransferase